METAIQLIHVNKCFGSQVVLDDLSLDLPRGRITFVLGKSGTGKSVLLKHIIGLLKPDSGRIVIDGRDITTLGERQLKTERMKFGMLFQDAALFDSMNVYENVAFPLREHRSLSEKEVREIVTRKLELVGLTRDIEKFPAELSGGMRKRVGLARAIALDPQIILYDEPTTGLDPLMVEQINDLIVRTQKAQNATSIVISHDIPTAMNTADVIAIMYSGKIVACGTPQELRSSDHPFVKEFIDAALVCGEQT